MRASAGQRVSTATSCLVADQLILFRLQMRWQAGCLAENSDYLPYKLFWGSLIRKLKFLE